MECKNPLAGKSRALRLALEAVERFARAAAPRPDKAKRPAAKSGRTASARRGRSGTRGHETDSA